MEEVTTDNKTSRLSGWGKYVLIALVASAVIAHLLISGWGGYVYAYVTCGVRQPLITNTFEEASKIYYTPDNRRYSAPGEGAYFKGYYCTERQARADGFLRAGP